MVTLILQDRLLEVMTNIMKNKYLFLNEHPESELDSDFVIYREDTDKVYYGIYGEFILGETKLGDYWGCPT